ncbi:hypothetical protein GCM10010246_24460 [Streptomyces cuspidosporus]|uniref:Uncharacterized protein n=1 Tax=Streptomyces cuspidosporus TaxID=66882 RepID=A0ABP5SU78_9ACTN
MRRAVGRDGAAGRDQGLGGDLAAEDARHQGCRAAGASEDVQVYPFQVEQVEETGQALGRVVVRCAVWCAVWCVVHGLRSVADPYCGAVATRGRAGRSHRPIDFATMDRMTSLVPP